MSAEAPPNPEDPIKDWITRREATHSPKTVESYRSALKHLREFLNEEGIEPEDLTPSKTIEFINQLQNNPDLATSSIKTYISHFNEFYSYYSDRGTFETNPVAEALRELDIDFDGTTHRREISIEEMSDFINSIDHPLTLTISVILGKTGIRAGELTNLDLRDVNLSHPGINEHLPEPRPEIRDRPDTLFVDSSIGAEEVHNGERRKGGNKRQRSTIIPIDEETKKTLIYWLAVRHPSRSEARPLLHTTSGGGGIIPGDRITPGVLHRCLRNETEEWGWWDKDASLEWNVTPHYFRHFFTTHARERMDDNTVKYIRGDAGGETMDRYTHNWGDKVESEYRQNIYTFFE